jgi:hypothetical protein
VRENGKRAKIRNKNPLAGKQALYVMTDWKKVPGGETATTNPLKWVGSITVNR